MNSASIITHLHLIVNNMVAFSWIHANENILTKVNCKQYIKLSNLHAGYPTRMIIWRIVMVNNETSTMPSCSGPIPAQKSWDNSVLAVVFSNTMPKMDFHYSHCFIWEKKRTKLIYHMPWLYQYPPLPFHRSYKN